MKYLMWGISVVASVLAIYLTGKNNDLAMIALGWAIYSNQNYQFISLCDK